MGENRTSVKKSSLWRRVTAGRQRLETFREEPVAIPEEEPSFDETGNDFQLEVIQSMVKLALERLEESKKELKEYQRKAIWAERWQKIPEEEKIANERRWADIEEYPVGLGPMRAPPADWNWKGFVYSAADAERGLRQALEELSKLTSDKHRRDANRNEISLHIASALHLQEKWKAAENLLISLLW